MTINARTSVEMMSRLVGVLSTLGTALEEEQEHTLGDINTGGSTDDPTSRYNRICDDYKTSITRFLSVVTSVRSHLSDVHEVMKTREEYVIWLEQQCTKLAEAEKVSTTKNSSLQTKLTTVTQSFNSVIGRLMDELNETRKNVPAGTRANQEEIDAQKVHIEEQVQEAQTMARRVVREAVEGEFGGEGGGPTSPSEDADIPAGLKKPSDILVQAATKEAERRANEVTEEENAEGEAPAASAEPKKPDEAFNGFSPQLMKHLRLQYEHREAEQEAKRKEREEAGLPQHAPSRNRGILPKHASTLLRKWLFEHWFQPYPTEHEKRLLCIQTSLSLAQVNNWFTNARRRILPKRKMVQEEKAKRSFVYDQITQVASQGMAGPPGPQVAPPQPTPPGPHPQQQVYYNAPPPGVPPHSGPIPSSLPSPPQMTVAQMTGLPSQQQILAHFAQSMSGNTDAQQPQSSSVPAKRKAME